MDIVILARGCIFPDNIVTFREISWINMKSGIGEAISVFTPDYHLSEEERKTVDTCLKEKHRII